MFTLEQIESAAKEKAAEHAKRAFPASEDELKETAKTFQDKAHSYVDLYNQHFETQVANIMAAISEKAETHVKNLIENGLSFVKSSLKATLDNQYHAYLDLYIQQVEENFKANKPPKASKTSAKAASELSSEGEDSSLEGEQEVSSEKEPEPAAAPKKKSKPVAKKALTNEGKIEAKALRDALQSVHGDIALNEKTLKQKAAKLYKDSTDIELYVKTYIESYKKIADSMSKEEKIQAKAKRRAKCNFGHGIFKINEDNLQKNAKETYSDPADIAVYIDHYKETYKELSEGKSLEDLVTLRAISDAKAAMHHRTTTITIEQIKARAKRYEGQEAVYEKVFVRTYNENKTASTVDLVLEEIPKGKNYDALYKAAYVKVSAQMLNVKPIDYEKFLQECKEKYKEDADEFISLYNMHKKKLATLKDEKSRVVSLAKKHGRTAANNGVLFNTERMQKKSKEYNDNHKVYFEEYKSAYNSCLQEIIAALLEDKDPKTGKPYLTEEQARVKHFATSRAKHNAEQGGKPKMNEIRETAINDFGKKFVDFYVKVYEETHKKHFKPKTDEKKVKALAFSRAWEMAEKGEMYEIDQVEDAAKEQDEHADLYKKTFIAAHENKMAALERKGVKTTGTLDSALGEVRLDDTMIIHIATAQGKREAGKGAGLDEQRVAKEALQYGDKASLYKDHYIKTYKENAINGIKTVQKSAFNKGVESARNKDGSPEETAKKLAVNHPGLEVIFERCFNEGYKSIAESKEEEKAKKEKTPQSKKSKDVVLEKEAKSEEPKSDVASQAIKTLSSPLVFSATSKRPSANLSRPRPPEYSITFPRKDNPKR